MMYCCDPLDQSIVVVDVERNILDLSEQRVYPFYNSTRFHEYMAVGVGWEVGSDQSLRHFLVASNEAFLLWMNAAVVVVVVAAVLFHEHCALNGDDLVVHLNFVEGVS